MGVIFPTLVAFAAAAATPGAAPVGAARLSLSPSPVMRLEGSAMATATVSARILRDSARVGADQPRPVEGRHARRTTVRDSDGKPVPALVFDFE